VAEAEVPCLRSFLGGRSASLRGLLARSHFSASLAAREFASTLRTTNSTTLITRKASRALIPPIRIQLRITSGSLAAALMVRYWCCASRPTQT